MVAVIFGVLTLLHGLIQSGQVSGSSSTEVLMFNLFSFVSVASYLVGLSVIGLGVAVLGLSMQGQSANYGRI